MKKNTKLNYHIEMEKIIGENEKKAYVPSLLLHSCCGPCSTYVLEYLSNYFRVSVLYYNPNIYPSEEYYFRKEEQRDLLDKIKGKYPIDFIETRYIPKEYYDKIEGFQKDKEGGKRCELCFDLRLRQAGTIAREKNFDFFTTTLSISPHKDSQLLNQLGEKISRDLGVAYLYSDFKKKNGFKRSVELTTKYGMYRQDYCGCVFSLKAMEERKKEGEK